MALDAERNRILAWLRAQTQAADSSALVEGLGLAPAIVERHLLYCADYGLATWKRVRSGFGVVAITDRGRDYLARQGL